MRFNHKSILIIDDCANIRQSLVVTLKWHGYEVFEAANGEEGFSLLQKIIPSVIILDLMMPVMNGWQFAELLAKDEALSKIPVIVVSAFFDNTVTINANAFLKKPFEFTQLLELISILTTGNKKVAC